MRGDIVVIDVIFGRKPIFRVLIPRDYWPHWWWRYSWWPWWPLFCIWWWWPHTLLVLFLLHGISLLSPHTHYAFPHTPLSFSFFHSLLTSYLHTVHTHHLLVTLLFIVCVVLIGSGNYLMILLWLNPIVILLMMCIDDDLLFIDIIHLLLLVFDTR